MQQITLIYSNYIIIDVGMQINQSTHDAFLHIFLLLKFALNIWVYMFIDMYERVCICIMIIYISAFKGDKVYN